MFPAVSLLTTFLLALSIVATPVEVRTSHVTLPFAKRINASGGAIKLVEHDQGRAAALKDRGAAIQRGKLDRRAGSIAVTNVAVSYVATVGVGSPATTCVLALRTDFITLSLTCADNLIVDTGSSTTWVGAGTAYKQTITSTNTGEPVVSLTEFFDRESEVHIFPQSVSYGSGSFSGQPNDFLRGETGN